MISETNFSRGYSSFWIEYFPWLNSYCQSITKYSLKHVHSVPNQAECPEHRGINNTLAFFHFRNLNSNINYDIESSKEEALKYMERFPRNNVNTYKFSTIDQKVISFQIEKLRSKYSKDLIISPFFPGCGIIDNCYGDIIQENKLVEIKAGERNIAPSDIKQLIVYTVLNWLSGSTTYKLDHLEIYNPRVGYLWNNSIDDLLVSITDIPKEDIFDQFTKYLITQSEDVELN